MLQQSLQLSHCCLFWLPQLLHTCCHNIHLQCEIIILLMLSDNTQTIHSSSSTLTLQRLQGIWLSKVLNSICTMLYFLKKSCTFLFANCNCLPVSHSNSKLLQAWWHVKGHYQGSVWSLGQSLFSFNTVRASCTGQQHASTTDSDWQQPVLLLAKLTLCLNSKTWLSFVTFKPAITWAWHLTCRLWEQA